MATLICLHDDIYYMLFIVLCIVCWFIIFSLYLGFSGVILSENLNLMQENDRYSDGALVAEYFDSCSQTEITWTVIPSFILILIGYPSISLLYTIDSQFISDIIIKVIGRQWYWSYEYQFGNTPTLNSSFDSNLLDFYPHTKFDTLDTKDKSLLTWLDTYSKFKLLRSDLRPENNLSYLHVDYPLVVPSRIDIKFLITSADVLHSWALPALGLKMDACPGRINQIFTNITMNTTTSFAHSQEEFTSKGYYAAFRGQCSELCGIGHGFMPIVVRSVPINRLFSVLNVHMHESNNLTNLVFTINSDIFGFYNLLSQLLSVFDPSVILNEKSTQVWVDNYFPGYIDDISELEEYVSYYYSGIFANNISFINEEDNFIDNISVEYRSIINFIMSRCRCDNTILELEILLKKYKGRLHKSFVGMYRISNILDYEPCVKYRNQVAEFDTIKVVSTDELEN